MAKFIFKCQNCGNEIKAYKKDTSTRRKCSKCGSYHIKRINSSSKKSERRYSEIKKTDKESGKLKEINKQSNKFPDKDELPRVSVIVVNYNGKRFLRGCFESLMRIHYPKSRLEIIMVDNGSTDGSVIFAGKFYPSVKILKNDANNYARANNLGIRNSLGDYVAILNNDTKVQKEWLIELVKAAEKDKRIGGAGSKVLLKNGRIDSAGLIEFPNFYWQQRGQNEIDRGQYDRMEEVYSLCGVSMLYKRKCLEEAGLEDEDFNIYVEEIDLSERCRKRGWKFIYAPKSIVIHEHGGTIKPDSEFFVFQSERNRMFFVAKHFPNEISGAVSTSHLFYKDIKKTHPLLFKILPEVFRKLVKEQGKDVLMKVLPEIYQKIKEITDFEKYDLLKEALEKDAESSLLRSDIDSLVSKEQERKEEIGNLKLEIEGLKIHLENAEMKESKRMYEIERLTNEIIATKNNLESAKEECYIAKSEIIILKNEKEKTAEEVERERKAHQEENNRLKNEKENREKEIESLKNRILEIEKSMKESLENEKAENDRLRGELESAKAELMKKKREIYIFYHSKGYRYFLSHIDKAYKSIRRIGR
ncbi:MAG: glycosyltransferase [Candidatus Woesearchaeota archaeon]|nr:glycosyltransferase [Candidatus Woesearchaeota archaeon]